MMIISIAFNNIKKNFKNYWSYFLSCTFSFFTLYLLMSVVYSSVVNKQLGKEKSMIELFIIASYLIAFFSVFFIWYSNSFFIKSRKKEFATYMLLGMSKGQTAFMNFAENFIILVSSFIASILLGLLFNKFFIMLLLYIIKASGNVPFEINIKALKFCAVLFVIIFVLITIHGTNLIFKDNLIDLFSASKKAEKKLKVSVLTYLLGILSFIFIGYGYYTSAVKLGKDISLAPIVIFVVVIGTILFFTSAASIFIYFKRRNEKKLYSSTNLISTSQLSYRYSGNVGTLSIIAVTTSVALCAVITCCGFFNKAIKVSRQTSPYSAEYISTSDSSDEAFQNILKKHTEVSVKYKDKIEIINTKAAKTSDMYPKEIISESNFNTAALHQNLNKINLKNENDCCYYYVNTMSSNSSYIGKNIDFSVSGKKYSLKISGASDTNFVNVNHSSYYIIVKDSLYKKIKAESSKDMIYSITGYMIKDDIIQKSFSQDVLKNMPKESKSLTFYDTYTSNMRMLGIMLYVGVFIGLVFLMATGSIIYFKSITEAREDRERFITLRKIGVSSKEIRGAVSKELSILFFTPLVVAVANSFAASKALEKLLKFSVLSPFVIIVLIYALLYGIYYLITVNSYMKTIE